MIYTIVIGGLHTDFIASQVSKILPPNQLTYGKELLIGPGGKSRNIAQMIALLKGKNTVAMIGKTSKDPFHLWKPPVQALKKAGVNIDFVQQLDFQKTKKMPAIALIPIDKNGNNQVYVLSGINNEFLPEDIDKAVTLFQQAKNKGTLALTLEQPLVTALHAIKLANKYGLKVLLDLGGIEEGVDYTELLNQNIFLLKPNEHEAKIATGVTVRDLPTAQKAAQKLLVRKINYVFITHGEEGGYLISKTVATHIPIPKLPKSGIKDSSGCGDQTMAALTAALTDGKDMREAVKIGILAGTLQFGKRGIQPVTKRELSHFTLEE